MVDSKQQKLEEWQDKMKNDWLDKQKLVAFEDGIGNVYAPSTTTTTTTTTQVPSQKTSNSPPLINVTSPAPHVDNVLTGGGASKLIVVISIACATLIGLILTILIVIWWCRRSAIKKKKQISIRRPLNMPQDEHIYAEIEPLQDAASVKPCAGTSGTSGDVILPLKRTKNKRKGVASFRAISTRIYKFFSSDIDSRVVSYNKSDHVATIEQMPPNPPYRNTAKHEKNHKKAVNRGESTASRRPLLSDRDSHLSSSLSSDMRKTVYNPLMKETNVEVSESCDSTGLSITLDNKSVPDSKKFCISTDLGENGRRNTEMTVPESTILIQDIKDFNLILEEKKKDEIPKRKMNEYFILESTQNRTDIERKNEVTLTPDKNTVKCGQMTGILDMNTSSPNNMTTKLVENVDVANCMNFNPESDSKLISPLKETTSPVINDLHSKTNITEVAESVDKDYELSKLAQAPSPPEIQNDDEYLRPVDVSRKPDYVDVFPSPPPRSTSLQPHMLTEKHNNS